MGYYPSKSVNARALIYLLFLPIILLYSLVLTGCISESPGISSIFLAELTNTTSGESRLRIGYLAMCGVRNSSQDAVCSSTVGSSPTLLAPTLQVPEALIQYGRSLQQVGFPILLAASGVLFTSGVIAFLMLKMTLRAQSDPVLPSDKLQRLPKRRARLVELTQGFLWLSSAFAFAVAYETTLTLSSLEFLSSSDLRADGVQIIRGTGTEVMQWLIFSFSFLFSLGVWRIIRPTGSGSRSGSNAPGLGPAFGGAPFGGAPFGGAPLGGAPLGGPPLGPPMGQF